MNISIIAVLREIWKMKWDWFFLLLFGTALFMLSASKHATWDNGFAVGFVIASLTAFLGAAFRRSRNRNS